MLTKGIYLANLRQQPVKEEKARLQKPYMAELVCNNEKLKNWVLTAAYQ